MREYNVGAVYINDNVYAGETNIPLLKGNQGYSISRVVKTSGTGTPGSYDTYTIYINTDPESIVGTFQVWNGTGNIGDMTKAEYDTDNDGIVDNAERVNNHTVDIDVPSNAKFTDTVYDDTAITNRVTTLENAGYITKSVSDLVNYYTKTETYTKAEVNALVDTIPKFAIEVVNSLPTHDISTTTIYLVRDDSSTGDIYKEYIYVNNTWEILGTQRVDLSNYYTKQETYNKQEVDTAIAGAGGNEIVIGTESDITPQTKALIKQGNYKYYNSEIAIGSSNNSNRPVWFKKGKNLFGNYGTLNGVFINGTANKTDSNANATSVFIQIEPSTTYTISKTKGNRFAIGFAETLPNNNTTLTGIEDDRTATSLTSTSASNSRYLVIYISLSDSETFANIVATIQVEKGSTATTYESYIAPSINVDNEEIYNKNVMDYSKTEQVVGTFLGKPIYRKVIESTTFTTDYYYIGLDVEGFVNQYGWVQRKDYPRLWQYIPSRVGDPMSISFLATDTSQGVKVDWGSNWQSQYATLFNKIVIVVEYTKTTD